MDKNNQDEKNIENDHIEQINSPKKESTTSKKENKKEEKISKTKQFQILNSKNKNNTDIEISKKETNLGDTIKLKLSDLRAKLEESEVNNTNKKKSLYDTVIIKLDDLINHRNALKSKSSQKITSIEDANITKKFHLFKPKNLFKHRNFKLNVDSDEFGRQLYNLNKIALINLNSRNSGSTRKYNSTTKLGHIEKIHISKSNYLKYQEKLNKFAVNKLYYKFAPKETNKYKLYKYSVTLSCLLFLTTCIIIVNWFIQGATINNLSNSLSQDTTIEKVTNEGILFNITDHDDTPDTNENTSMYWKYLKTPLSSVDFTELLKDNKDTVGWLIVNNTSVNYPVVQTTNNDYYLNHAFDKSYNTAGWVFADFRDNFDNLSMNTVIYGHGRKDKIMFGSLNDTLNAKWYLNEDNQIIQLSTLKYNTMWQIFSIYKVKAESYYITTDFSSDNSFKTFIETMKSRSIYDFKIDVGVNDKLLTLSTCYDNNGMRTVIQAKLVKIQER